MKEMSLAFLAVLIFNSCQLKYVVPEPVVEAFTPASGKVGTTVTIMGSCFGTQPTVYLGGIQVTVASVLSTNNTYSDKITFVVPSGALSGKIKVTNPGGSSTSSVNFIVN